MVRPAVKGDKMKKKHYFYRWKVTDGKTIWQGMTSISSKKKFLKAFKRGTRITEFKRIEDD